MNYLIIPDVHNRVEWAESLIAAFPGRVVIFLGDYFDDFNDTPAHARVTAEWLRHSLGEGRLHLMGNHDLPYRWPRLTCPGWTKDKHLEAAKLLKPSDWSRLRLCIILRPEGRRPLVVSHAGITLANLYGVADFRDVAKGGRMAHLRERSVDKHLNEIHHLRELCQYQGDVGGDHHWFNQGARMGRRDAAGPFWVDRHDFNPIAGIDQIVGHTHVTTPQRHCLPHADAPVSENWFVDGNGKLAALVDDGIVAPIWATPERLGEPAT